MGQNGNGGDLDGWKEIADYLGRSVRAAQRWEAELGLPVHRMKTSGGQIVYARRDEIDAWRARQEVPPKPAASVPGTLADALPDLQPDRQHMTANTRTAWRHPAAGVLVLILATAAMAQLLVSDSRSGDAPLDYELTAHALVARREGTMAWEYRFPRPVQVKRPLIGDSMAWPADRIHVADVHGDGRPEVLAAVSYATPGALAGDELFCFSSDGTLLWTYRPELTLRFGAGSFSAPWLITAVNVTPAGARQDIYVAVAHHRWWPAALLRIAADGRPDVRMIHSGHIYAIAFWDRDGVRHVAAAGVNNEYAQAAVALLRADGPAGRSPQAHGSKYECEGCPTGAPEAYFLFSRTEIGRVASDPYNRAMSMNVVNAALDVHVFEDPWRPAAATTFRIAPDLRIAEAAPGDGYWQAHRQLEDARTLRHSAEACPYKALEARRFTPATGWTAHQLTFDTPLPGTTR